MAKRATTAFSVSNFFHWNLRSLVILEGFQFLLTHRWLGYKIHPFHPNVHFLMGPIQLGLLFFYFDIFLLFFHLWLPLFNFIFAFNLYQYGCFDNLTVGKENISYHYGEYIFVWFSVSALKLVCRCSTSLRTICPFPVSPWTFHVAKIVICSKLKLTLCAHKVNFKNY